MRAPRLSELLDYVPPVVAFIAAAVAVIGSPKWNSAVLGLSRITPLGWVVLAIGVMALIASVLVTSRNKKDQAKQKHIREHLAAIGASQLLRALNHAVHPFSNSSIWQEQCEAPESPTDLLDSERRKILATLNLNSPSPYADGSFDEIKWHSLLESAAARGVHEITTILQIYAGYLSPEVMDAITQLLYSDFLQVRLLNIHDIVLANTHHAADRPVPFFWVADDRMHNADYEEFWRLMANAMTLCGAEMTQHGEPKFAHP